MQIRDRSDASPFGSSFTGNPSQVSRLSGEDYVPVGAKTPEPVTSAMDDLSPAEGAISCESGPSPAVGPQAVAKMHGVKSAPGLMQAHQAGSYTSKDHTAVHTPPVEAEGNTMPAGNKLELSKPGEQGGDGMTEITKAQTPNQPVMAHVQQNPFSNSATREGTGTTGRLPVTAAIYRKSTGIVHGPAVANPSNGRFGSV